MSSIAGSTVNREGPPAASITQISDVPVSGSRRATAWAGEPSSKAAVATVTAASTPMES